MYIRNIYYKGWDTTAPPAWYGYVDVGADSIEDVLDKIYDWYNTNQTLDNLSESPGYAEMMDAILVLSGLDSDMYDYEYSDCLYAFYEYYNAAAYYFNQVNPDYTVQEIMD